MGYLRGHRESTREATRPDGSTVLITEYNTTQRTLNKEHDEWVYTHEYLRTLDDSALQQLFDDQPWNEVWQNIPKRDKGDDYDYDDDNDGGQLIGTSERLNFKDLNP